MRLLYKRDHYERVQLGKSGCFSIYRIAVNSWRQQPVYSADCRLTLSRFFTVISDSYECFETEKFIESLKVDSFQLLKVVAYVQETFKPNKAELKSVTMCFSQSKPS